MNVLVIGLGYTGSLLASELARRGHDVVGLRRSEGSEPRGVRVVRGDVTGNEVWARLPPAPDQVVVLLSAGERSLSAYERTYFEGATRIRQAFPSARLVWVSSTAAYEDDAGLEVTDETLARAAGGTAAVLLRAEAAATAGPHLVVRPSGIYGPGRTRLLERLARGDVPPSERDVWTNRIHRDDLVSALTFCVERPALSGTLLASDQEPARLGDMQDWVLAERRGVPPVATAAAPSRATAPPATTAPADPSRPAPADARKSRRIHATRLTALGFSWRYPSYREGYAELLASLEQGALEVPR